MPESAAHGGTLQQRLARDVRTQIEAGALRDGEALPSTRALAERFGVSLFTVNEAMKLLAADGLVENQSRSRRVVRSTHIVRRDPPRPRAVLIGGYAGSGKTELGRIVSRLTGWALIDKDAATRPVVEQALEALGQSPNDRESEVYRTRVRPAEYEALLGSAHESTACGAGVIVAAPFVPEFHDARWIERQRAQFADEGVPASFVWVRCDAESMHTYLRRRGAGRDAAKLRDWESFVDTLEPDYTPTTECIFIENSADAEPLRAQAERLVAKLGEV